MALIHANGEKAYPDEGAGFLFGLDGDVRQVKAIFNCPILVKQKPAMTVFLVSPQDYLKRRIGS